jgi:hypothetical protein
MYFKWLTIKFWENFAVDPSYWCRYINLVIDLIESYPNNNAVTCRSNCKIGFHVIHSGKQTFVSVYKKLLTMCLQPAARQFVLCDPRPHL